MTEFELLLALAVLSLLAAAAVLLSGSGGEQRQSASLQRLNSSLSRLDSPGEFVPPTPAKIGRSPGFPGTDYVALLELGGAIGPCSRGVAPGCIIAPLCGFGTQVCGTDEKVASSRYSGFGAYL